MTSTRTLEVVLIYDLHTHSNASDGILSPEALVSRAKLKGVSHLALTDHDTVSGLPKAKVAADREGLELICGIEFSSLWQNINIHIVGLNIDVNSPELQAMVASQHQARVSRGEEIGRRLAKLGYPEALDGAKRFAGDALLGRPHFARYLVEIGAVSNVNQAFKRYLGNGKSGDVKQVWPSVPEVVRIIVAAGGNAVLAHPLRYSLTVTKLRRLLTDFKEAGGSAMEVVSGHQTSNETKTLEMLCAQFELYASCGSDFHVPDQPWQELGGFGKLPDSCTPVWQAWEQKESV